MGLSTVDLIRNRDELIPPETFPGIYRAFVRSNKDPQTRARLRVEIPMIHSEGTSVNSLPWADCCNLAAGPNKAALYLPKVGDVVWIMFEHGNPQYPVWMGSWWGAPKGKTELPEELRGDDASDHFVLKTAKGNIVDMYDGPTGCEISIISGGNNKIIISDIDNLISVDASATLSDVSIKPSLAGKVSIGNLPITPCNDFPACPLLGAHAIGTTMPGNQIMIP